jgi:hypothetical protein
MTPSRKQPGVAFWATVVLVVALVAYPLSFGPWCWCTSRLKGEIRSVPPVYGPITLLAETGRPAGHAIRWYASLCAPDDWELFWSSPAIRPTEGQHSPDEHCITLRLCTCGASLIAGFERPIPRFEFYPSRTLSPDRG